MYILIGLSFLICLTLNLITTKDFISAFLNSLIIPLSWMLFRKEIDGFLSENKNSLTFKIGLLSLAIMPVLLWKPPSYYIQIFLILGLIMILIRRKGLMILGIGVIIFSTLVASSIIDIDPFGTDPSVDRLISFDREWTIFLNVYIQDIIKNSIDRLRADLVIVGFPLGLTAIFYNKIFGNIIYFIRNILEFLSINTIYSVVSISNLAPLTLGIFSSLRSRNYLILFWVITTLLIMGINRSPEKFISFYNLTPVFIYYILIGLTKMNFKIYAALMVLSIFIFIYVHP